MRVLDGTPSPKRYTTGTHRACEPRETLERCWPLASAMGITRLANVTGLDVIGLPMWTCIRPNSRGLSTSQGKGFDSLAAKVSALMESIESWHAERITLPLRHESAYGLSREAHVADLARLNTYADAVIRDDTPLLWVEGVDLMTQRPTWLPFDCVSTNYVWPGRGGVLANFVMSSNGLASGNTLCEAIVHGLAEVIERDAVALTADEVRAGAPSRRVDPRTIDDPDSVRLLAMLEKANVLAAVFDITSDTGIPAFACTIVDAGEQSRWRTLPAFSGYGAHTSRGIALLRAITEAVQSRLTHISGSRDDISAAEYQRTGNADDLRRYREVITATQPTADFTARASRCTESFEGDLRIMLDALRAVGVESVLVADLTRAEVGIPVVKVVVPGLEAPAAMLRGKAVRRGKRARDARPAPAAVPRA